MSRPHVLVVNVNFAPNTYGGATVVAEEVAKALMVSGAAHVTAVSLCQRAELVPYTVIKCEAGGISSYLINVPARRTYTETYDNPQVTVRMAELLDVLRPDLVHVHCIQDLGAGIIKVAEEKGVPVILSVHDFWWICERQFMQRIDQRYCGQDPVRIDACAGCAENLSRAKERHAHLADMGARAAVVTYPSRFAKELSERSGFAIGTGVVWENGVHHPAPRFFDDQKRRRREDNTIVFGYLGGPSHIKGWPQIRQAFAGVKAGPFRVKLVDGGRDQSWWRGVDLNGLAGEWKVIPRFEQADMDAFYAQIDVLLFMSQWKETYGLAIREALARGIRVLQTDSGGTAEHAGPQDLPRLCIGAPAQDLRAVLETAIAAHPMIQAPVPVQSFVGQAREFERLMAQIV